MTTRAAQRERYSFGNLEEVLELPDLIAVQRESFQWLLDEGLAQTFRDISPIKDFTETLSWSSSSIPTTRICARRRSTRWRSARKRT